MSVFRAVPGVVQIFLAYYGLPEIIPALKTWSPEVMVILALGFKYAAYMAVCGVYGRNVPSSR